MRLEEAQPEDLKKISMALQQATKDMHPVLVMHGVHIYLYALEFSCRISRQDLYAGLLNIASWFEGDRH